MKTSRLQNAVTYVLLGAGLMVLAYSIWLGGLLVTTQLRAAGGLVMTDSGPGLFLLIYAALPAAVVCLSLSQLFARRNWQYGGAPLTAFAFLLATVQLLWLVGLAPRASREVVSFAIAASLVVVLVGLATLRTRTRIMSPPRLGATGGRPS